MEEYSELTRRKNDILSSLNNLPDLEEIKDNLNKQLKQVEEDILNPENYCDELFTEEKFLELYNARVIYDINYFSKLIGTNLEHCYEDYSHSDGRELYSYTYQCKYCGKKTTEFTKR